MVSPLLANVYLLYEFDLWADVWREKVAHGDEIVTRHAGDIVVGFQHRAEVERFLKEFEERLVEFGRFARAGAGGSGGGVTETSGQRWPCLPRSD